MVFNIKADIVDAEASVEAIQSVLDMEHNYGMMTEGSIDYCERLKGFLRSMQSSLEEELLRYDDNSFEASRINLLIVKIESILKQGVKHA